MLRRPECPLVSQLQEVAGRAAAVHVVAERPPSGGGQHVDHQPSDVGLRPLGLLLEVDDPTVPVQDHAAVPVGQPSAAGRACPRTA